MKLAPDLSRFEELFERVVVGLEAVPLQLTRIADALELQNQRETRKRPAPRA